METSVHRDRRRRRRRDDGLFFSRSPRASSASTPSRASRVSRLASLRKNRYVRDGYETPGRAIDPRVSTRVRARPRVPSRARIDRAYFSPRVPRTRTLTSAAGIARARRSSESLGENGCRRASRTGANARHSCACARARESLSPRERERARGGYYHRSFHREFAARRARATTR